MAGLPTPIKPSLPTVRIPFIGSLSRRTQDIIAAGVWGAQRIEGWNLMLDKNLIQQITQQVLAQMAAEMTVNIQVFTENSVYTPSANLISCVVECMGGGGGGGGALGSATASTEGFMIGGGGGSSGSYSRSALDASQVSSGVSIIIGPGGNAGTAAGGVNGGNGGNTLFGNFIVANGGLGGNTCNITLAIYGANGGAPAPAGTGDLAVASNPGHSGGGIISNPGIAGGGVWGGDGGAGFFGGAGAGGYSAIGAGPVGVGGIGNAGGGGGGGASGDNTQAVNGGAGGMGICIVTEYIISSGA